MHLAIGGRLPLIGLGESARLARDPWDEFASALVGSAQLLMARRTPRLVLLGATWFPPLACVWLSLA